MLLCETVDKSSYRSCCEVANLISSFLKSYTWLTDAFVLDFFTESHWQMLPKSWQDTFQEVEFSSLADFIALDNQKCFQRKEVMPLSLLAFRASVQLLSLERQPPKDDSLLVNSINRIREGIRQGDEDAGTMPSAHQSDEGNVNLIVAGQQLLSLDQNLRRSVKPKKQHEILRLAEVMQLLIKDRSSCRIVDVGSGQGHLSRLLSLSCGYNVVTIEGEESHITGAKILDDKAITSFRKRERKIGERMENVPYLPSPQHIVQRIDKNTTAVALDEILEVICKSDPNSSFDSSSPTNYWLVGLHTCGNLATTMLKLLSESRTAVGIVSVACCYMKLDTEEQSQNDSFSGYPMSRVVSHSLSYEAREVACHAIELYQQKLRDNASSLKIHCYRATLEVLIVKYHPRMKRLGLRSVKRAERMSFVEYATLALDRKGLKIPVQDFTSPMVSDCMSKWRRVIIFYTLRLFLAPVIETLILIDRLLYLYERGIRGLVIPLFNPKLSPRNHILFAQKIILDSDKNNSSENGHE